MFKVCKFGGSVLQSSSDIKKILDILLSQNQKTIIVFSAFYQQTNYLIEIAEIANQSLEYKLQLLQTINFHKNIVIDLGLELNFLDFIFDEIFTIYSQIFLNKNLCPQILDTIMSFGERLSTLIIYEFLKNKLEVILMPAQNIIKTDSNFGAANVDFEQTSYCLNKALSENIVKYIILGGFIGSNKQENITTLGRNGSDYTAAIISNLVKAKCLEIWKDVDGIYTADPKIVKNARFIDMISYEEMLELAFFGNKVIAMTAMKPIIENNISVYIKNIKKPLSKNTLISPQTNFDHKIKGVTKIDNCVLFQIIAFNNIVITNFSERVNETLSKNNIHILFYKTHEFLVCVKENEAKMTQLLLSQEFSDEISKGNVIINKTNNQSVVAVILHDVIYISKINHELFCCLEIAKIKINGHNNSTTSIVLILDSKLANKAINVIHSFLIKDN